MAAVEFGKYLEGKSAGYHACIEACLECWVACEACATACLGEPDVEKMAECIRLDRDCAAACLAAAAAMIRGDEQAEAICRVCAESG